MRHASRSEPKRLSVSGSEVGVSYTRVMHTRLSRFAWAPRAFNVVVILIGGVVRATGSGAGCGPSWPTCHGEMIPVLHGDTAVEYTHRAVSTSLGPLQQYTRTAAIVRSQISASATPQALSAA